jgi:hypothetical protein
MAGLASRRPRGGDARPNVRNFVAFWQDRLDLFRDIEAAMGEDLAGAKGLEVAARVPHWREEGLCRMSAQQFESAARFLDKALASLH